MKHIKCLNSISNRAIRHPFWLEAAHVGQWPPLVGASKCCLPLQSLSCLTCCGLVVILLLRLNWRRSTNVVSNVKRVETKQSVPKLLPVFERMYSPNQTFTEVQTQCCHMHIYGSLLHCLLNCLHVFPDIFHSLFVHNCLSVSLYLPLSLSTPPSLSSPFSQLMSLSPLHPSS